METKKTTRADLERKKSIFLEIGFILSLAGVFLAFEWKTSVPEPGTFDLPSEISDPMEVLIPVTQTISQPAPPPPPKAFNMIDITESEYLTLEDLDIEDATDVSGNQPSPTLNGLQYETEENTDEIVPFLPLEDMPVFPGNVQQWIAKQVRYPAIALENGIQGKVFVQFVVEKDGSISHIRVIRGIDPSIDQEAIRVISRMPKWTPGKQRNKPVRVAYTLPISFQLGE